MGPISLVLHQQAIITKQTETAMKTIDKQTGYVYIRQGEVIAESHKIKQWTVSKLRVYRPQHGLIPKQEVLKSIQSIEFSQLTVLNLSSNNLESVEAINKIRMPVISTIILRENEIVSCNTFRKSRWSKLKVLSINNNFIQQLDFLSEMDPCVPELDCQVSSFEKAQGQSLTFLAKIIHQKDRHSKIELFSSPRIENQSMALNSSERKCPKCIIFVRGRFQKTMFPVMFD